MNKFKILIRAGLLLLLSGCATYHYKASLLPEKPSTVPDYFCTWNVQGYVSSYGSTLQQRNAMTERNLFGKGRYEKCTAQNRCSQQASWHIRTL